MSLNNVSGASEQSDNTDSKMWKSFRIQGDKNIKPEQWFSTLVSPPIVSKTIGTLKKHSF